MNKAALLIGVSEYSEPELKPLPSAVEDVQAMQRVLLRSGEFAVKQIRVLPNPAKQAVEESIYWLFANRQREDLLLFYFSGHGIKDETGRLYFSLPETRKDQGRLVKHTAVPATVLHESMNDSRSTCQVLVLDCCFSGAFAKGLTIKDDGSVDIPAQLGGKGRAIFTSSNTIEYSFQQEGLTLSVYTHFFVEGLEKGAADLDGDGLISADELHTYVRDKVKTAAPAMTPQFFPVEQGHKIYLARSAKDDPGLKYRKAIEQKVNQGSFQVGKKRFSVPARRALDLLSRQLNIATEVAAKIENEVLQPFREYQRKLQEYEQTFQETLEDEDYPFSKVIQTDLKDYQTLLGLRDEDVLEIEANVLLREMYAISVSDEDDLSSEQGVDYTQLRNLLKTGDWQEADRETVRVMLKTANREGEHYLSKEDIENFPCQDLRTIDQLWVKYSKGHFGFSVQKRIWQECGSPMECNQEWEKFNNRVGWQVSSKRISYEQAIFDTSGSRGHLPISWGNDLNQFDEAGCWSKGSRRGRGKVIFHGWNQYDLFSRAQTCQL